MFFLILVLFLIAACTLAGNAPPSTQSTPTMVPPTSTPIPTNIAEAPPIYEITFDGSACLSTAPAVLLSERYSFAYKITDETVEDLNITLLDKGHTLKENMDLQSEPGDYFPKPDWARDARLVGKEWNETYDAEVVTFSLKLEGVYAVTIGGYNPNSAWFCPPIEIQGELSD